MGCGQSKLGIHQKKSKSKKNESKRPVENDENDDETEDADETIDSDASESEERIKKSITAGGDESLSLSSRIKAMAQPEGPVLAQSDISSSQLDFFKMLDEKIENGPDYEESDEEERKERWLQEWRATCAAGQQKKNESKTQQKENWNSPSRGTKPYHEDYEKTQGRRANPVDTQRFPTGYSPCPPNNTLNVHLQNSFRTNIPNTDQTRMAPRMPVGRNYPHRSSPFVCESCNNCEDTSATNELSNPFRYNYSQAMLRQTSISSLIPSYSDTQRLYGNVRQLPDYPRPYQDQTPYQMPRPIPPVNILHERRMYSQDMNARPYPTYPDDTGQNDDVTRMMMEMSRPYHDIQRPDNIRPQFGTVENQSQRMYHERPLDTQRQYVDGPRQMEGPRPPIVFQRPQLLTQRSVQEPPRMYRDLENDDQGYPRQERFSETPQEGPTGSGILNPNHYTMGRSLSVDVQYVAGPPPPREMIPLQGAPGPPQGSPRPLVARALQPNMHRLPADPVIHFRRPQGAFT